MELGETLADAARREAFEEANAEVGIGDLYTLFSLPHLSQVYAFFTSDLLNLDFSAGSESLDVKLFDESEIPWDDLAFETVRQSLTFFFEDRRSGHFPKRIINLSASSRIFEQASG
jgi:ADP-ribose pyrophosphatase YjhB (NUDIX family)